jgi:dCTP deaminase
MILSGPEIKRVLNKDIFIEPFVESRLNPNSYNLTLSPELMVYTDLPLDMKKPNPAQSIHMGPEGYLLEPGKLYLARTQEYTQTYNLVPMLEGRSSIGRLGLYVHVTAGFGDVGFPVL